MGLHGSMKNFNQCIYPYLNMQWQKMSVHGTTITLFLQYYNNGNYCPGFVGQQDDVYHILVATDHYNIESVLMHIKNRRDWRFHGRYFSIFNTSPCMNYSTERCQLYTSLYRSVINQLSE